MKHEIVDLSGKKSGEIDLDESVWGIEPNIAVMHQALVRQLANARIGTADTKTRAEVRGGGRKPWRQKGTGRARQGSIRAPHWVGGGVVFGPHPRKYTQRMPKRMRRLAVRSALSAKLRDGRVTFVTNLADIEPKTKAGLAAIKQLPEARSVLFVSSAKSENIERATGNLQDVKIDPGQLCQRARSLEVRPVGHLGRCRAGHRGHSGAAGSRPRSECLEAGAVGRG